MLLRFFFPAFIFCLFWGSCVPRQQARIDSLPATALHPYGRFVLNQAQSLELVSSAAHFGVGFEGQQVRLFVAASKANTHNYLQYELDGVYQQKIKVSGRSSEPVVITAPNPGRHTLWVYKATEAHTGPVVIEKITGQGLKPLRRPKAPLIEFIGNSITCGAAADPSEVPCGSGQYHDQHNAYMAYGPRLARSLQADFILSSVSGIGVYRNWNSLGPAMPQVYEQVDFQLNSPQLWDFRRFTPQVVSIALGTNDLSLGDGKKERSAFDSAAFVSSYSGFVQKVKSKYPKARIALLSSPMAKGKSRQKLQNCLTAVKQRTDALYPADKPVALHFFQPMQARGCSGHPNVEDHGVLARELLPFFKKLLENH